MLPEQRLEHLVLAAEVSIKPAFGQPGARGNVIDPRFLEAVRGKLEQRCFQELRNAFAGRKALTYRRGFVGIGVGR